MMNNKEIKHIRCEVTNCMYHTKDSHCTAGEITVGTKNACCCGETACETFKLDRKIVSTE